MQIVQIPSSAVAVHKLVCRYSDFIPEVSSKASTGEAEAGLSLWCFWALYNNSEEIWEEEFLLVLFMIVKVFKPNEVSPAE